MPSRCSGCSWSSMPVASTMKKGLPPVCRPTRAAVSCSNPSPAAFARSTPSRSAAASPSLTPFRTILRPKRGVPGALLPTQGQPEPGRHPLHLGGRTAALRHVAQALLDLLEWSIAGHTELLPDHLGDRGERDVLLE